MTAESLSVSRLLATSWPCCRWRGPYWAACLPVPSACWRGSRRQGWRPPWEGVLWASRGAIWSRSTARLKWKCRWNSWQRRPRRSPVRRNDTPLTSDPWHWLIAGSVRLRNWLAALQKTERCHNLRLMQSQSHHIFNFFGQKYSRATRLGFSPALAAFSKTPQLLLCAQTDVVPLSRLNQKAAEQTPGHGCGVTNLREVAGPFVTSHSRFQKQSFSTHFVKNWAGKEGLSRAWRPNSTFFTSISQVRSTQHGAFRTLSLISCSFWPHLHSLHITFSFLHALCHETKAVNGSWGNVVA